MKNTLLLRIFQLFLSVCELFSQSNTSIERSIFLYGVEQHQYFSMHRTVSAIANEMDTVFSFSTPAIFPVGIASDGTSFWISDVDSNRIYKFSSAGQLLKTLNISDRVGPMLWVAPRLWGVVEQSGKIVEIDTSTGVVRTLFHSPDTCIL